VHLGLRGEFFLQGLQALEATPGQRQRPAGGGETPRRGASEAGSRAGDENGFVHDSALRRYVLRMVRPRRGL